MNQLNIPSYSVLLPQEKQIRAIQDLYFFIDKWKKEVDKYIEEADATFRGTFNSLAELEALTDVDANDFAWVIDIDSAGNTIYKHYKYVEGTGWLYEYTLSNPAFSTDEWAAIQSGITSGLVTKLSDLPTNAQLTQLLAAIVGTNADTYDVDSVKGAKAYADYILNLRRTTTIYIGAGEADDDFDMEPQVISQLQETFVDLTMTDEYIYVLYPKTNDIVITMSSIDIPVTKVSETTIEGVVFNVYRSQNSYSGEIKVGLLLKY